ncbi:RNA-directed DNA polymerase, eukaryota [Tanacetum coccineum]
MGAYALLKADTPTHWIKCIPIKVNVFVWKALQDRLPTRSNLVRINILIDSLSCPICDGEPEDSSHLFFSLLLGERCDKLRLGAKSKEVLEGVFYVSWWSLWNFRNHLLFADSNPRKDAIFDEIVLRSFNWCLARGNRTLNWVIDDVVRQLSFEETKFDGEAGFVDVAGVEPIVAEFSTQEPIVAEVNTQGNGQEDEAAPSDGQFFYDDEGIDTTYETEYDV